MRYLGEADLRFFGDPIESSFSFLLLDFKRDAFDRSSLDSFDEMGGESSDFVSKFLGGDFSDFAQDSLVNMEVVGEFLVVFFK